MLKALAVPFFVVLAGIAAHSLSPATVEKHGDLEVREVDGHMLVGGVPFTGRLIERFPNGNIYLNTGYVDGIKNGYEYQFAFTGARQMVWHYVGGLKHGRQTGWFIEGPIRFMHSFDFGLLHGTQTDWYMTGEMFNQQVYDHGVEVARKVFYSSSEVFSNYVKRGGRKYGIDGGELCFEGKKTGEL